MRFPARDGCSRAGIGLCQLGDVDTAIREMRLAEQSGHRRRDLDAPATLGATFGRAGYGRQGLACLERAVAGSRGALSGRNLARRADVLLVLGRTRTRW